MWMNSKKPILALAPMADMTDSPFCRVCREVAGDDFVIFREMVSAEAIVRGNEKTLKMCEFDEIERPIVQQIFGADPEVMASAAQIIADKYKPDGIDINMGCPVPKISGKANSGAALMKDVDKAKSSVKALKNANLCVPVTVKTRLGWADDKDILDFAVEIEKAGAGAISLHGRTKKQGYSGKANWERIGEVKKLLSIPLIANGDVNSQEDVQKCLEVTDADGVMIGRGALGNPWIFRTPNTNSQTPDIDEIKKVVLRHAELHLERYGEENGLTTFRKHLALYFKGIPGIKKLRAELVQVSTLDELSVILNKMNERSE
jgi:tRNA-dihydrouridine synthase B